jgi:hypothetical protein
VYTVYLCPPPPKRPAHGTVPSQVATHLRTDRVCRVLGRSWIRTQDSWFGPRTPDLVSRTPDLNPGLLIWTQDSWFEPRTPDLNPGLLIWAQNSWFGPRTPDLNPGLLIWTQDSWFEQYLFKCTQCIWFQLGRTQIVKYLLEHFGHGRVSGKYFTLDKLSWRIS